HRTFRPRVQEKFSCVVICRRARISEDCKVKCPSQSFSYRLPLSMNTGIFSIVLCRFGEEQARREKRPVTFWTSFVHQTKNVVLATREIAHATVQKSDVGQVSDVSASY